MQLGALVDLTRQYLGQAAPYYDAALLVRFLQFAQNLYALHPDGRVLQRKAFTFPAQLLVMDLRTIVPRYLAIRRVVLGNVETQEETAVSGIVTVLRRTNLDNLAARRGWIDVEDTPRQYFRLGATLLGVYPRPANDTLLTVLTTTLPAPFLVDSVTGEPSNLAQEPDLAPANHPFLADIAMGLLLMREGTAEAQKGIQRLVGVLGPQMFAATQKTLNRMLRSSMVREGHAQGGLTADVEAL